MTVFGEVKSSSPDFCLKTCA